MNFDKKNVLLASQHDKQAFSALYKSIYLDLYKMAFYIMGNKESAEDIVSETVLDAYKGIPNIQDISKFEQWILKILTTKCKKAIRSKYSRFSVFNPNARNIENYNLISCDDIPSAGERTDIQRSLAKLSYEDRVIISLCIIEGYKSHEAALILSLKPATVRSRLNRALTKMRKDLEAK